MNVRRFRSGVNFRRLPATQAAIKRGARRRAYQKRGPRARGENDGVPINAERISSLARLGLTTNEARAYLALLDLASAPAKDVAALARVPLAKVYRALDGLVARSLATVEPAHPKRFAPLPVRPFLESLARDLRARADEVARETDALAHALRVADAPLALAPRDGFAVVRGRRAAHARVVDAIALARKSILARATPGFVQRLARSADALGEAVARGARATLATPHAPASERARAALAHLADVVNAPAPADADVTILVVDDAEAVIQRATPDDASLLRGDDVAFATRDAAIARALAALARPTPERPEARPKRLL